MPLLLLCITWLSWGLAYPLTAIAFVGFDVMTLRCAVQVIGAAALLVQALACGRSLRVERAAWPDLVVAGLLNMAIFPILMALGVYLMSPGRTSVVVYTLPIWAALFARIMLGERLTRNRIIALILAVAAVIALVSQSLPNLRNAPLGAGLTILAAVSFGLGTVWLKRRQWRADPSVVAFWQLTIGLVPMALVWLVLSAPPDLSQAGAPQWLALLFIGVMANGAAYFAWFRLVRALPASITGISSLVVPCIAVGSSAWLADERLGPQDLLAMGLIAAALACVVAEQFGIGRPGSRQPGAAAKAPS